VAVAATSDDAAVSSRNVGIIFNRQSKANDDDDIVRMQSISVGSSILVVL
jgi:hypothetical protein